MLGSALIHLIGQLWHQQRCMLIQAKQSWCSNVPHFCHVEFHVCVYLLCTATTNTACSVLHGAFCMLQQMQTSISAANTSTMQTLLFSAVRPAEPEKPNGPGHTTCRGRVGVEGQAVVGCGGTGSVCLYCQALSTQAWCVAHTSTAQAGCVCARYYKLGTGRRQLQLIVTNVQESCWRLQLHRLA